MEEDRLGKKEFLKRMGQLYALWIQKGYGEGQLFTLADQLHNFAKTLPTHEKDYH